MRKETDRLEVMYCVPGRNYPGAKVVVAKVKDGKDVQFFTFGRDYPLRYIHEQIPRLVCDYKFKRKKAV